jgi:hypothetical protein
VAAARFGGSAGGCSGFGATDLGSGLGLATTGLGFGSGLGLATTGLGFGSGLGVAAIGVGGGAVGSGASRFAVGRCTVVRVVEVVRRVGAFDIRGRRDAPALGLGLGFGFGLGWPPMGRPSVLIWTRGLRCRVRAGLGLVAPEVLARGLRVAGVLELTAMRRS